MRLELSQIRQHVRAVAFRTDLQVHLPDNASGVNFKNMPWDEMIQAMVPSYQKHLTKGDIDSMVAFYSSPTGQKVLGELPAIMSDAMQSMMPILQRYMGTVKERIDQETAAALKQSEKKTN